MFVVAMGLIMLSSIVLLVVDFKRMGTASRIFLLLQFAAILLMVIAWLGISF